MVRNLKHSLLKAEPGSSEGMSVHQNCTRGPEPHKRTKVGVLISGTGEHPV